jgi:taurine dioxygenase
LLTCLVHADVAQLVEHHLAKVRVAGSNPVVRSLESEFRLTDEHVLLGRELRPRDTTLEGSAVFAADRITAVLGAEISGIDLADDLDDETIKKLDATLAEHKLLCFRDQFGLDPDKHLKLGERFGELAFHPFGPKISGKPKVTVVSDEPVEGAEAYVYPTESIETWHTDLTCLARPPRAAILRAVEIPPLGRDTMWADMQAAYEGLSSKMQRLLDDLTAAHDYMEPFAPLIKGMNESEESLRERLPVPEHPVIRTHPVTGGRSIYVNQSFTKKIVGMHEDESRHLLEFLWSRPRIPEYQVRIRWRPGTVVMWDNRSTQHYIVFDLPAAEPRILHRVHIAEDHPL